MTDIQTEWRKFLDERIGRDISPPYQVPLSAREAEELEKLLQEAAGRQMTPEEIEAQRQSWVRGMTARCEHGIVDFEQCPDCRGWRK